MFFFYGIPPMQLWWTGKMSLTTCFVLSMSLWNIFSCATNIWSEEFSYIMSVCLNLVTLISFFQLQYLVKQIQQQLIFVEPFPVFKLGKFDLLDSKLSKHYSRTGLIYRDNHIGIIAFKFSFSINFYNIFLKKQSSGISFAINDFNMVFP